MRETVTAGDGASAVRSPREPTAAPGKGAPLDGAFGGSDGVPYRAEMEAAFSERFDDVRVRHGAGDLDVHGADAATRGTEVSFAGSAPDRGLVAHELAHVVQFRRAGGSGVAFHRSIAPESSAAEVEADAAASAVTAGRPVTIREAPDGAIHLARRRLPSRPRGYDSDGDADFDPHDDAVASELAETDTRPRAKPAPRWQAALCLYRAIALGAGDTRTAGVLRSEVVQQLRALQTTAPAQLRTRIATELRVHWTEALRSRGENKVAYHDEDDQLTFPGIAEPVLTNFKNLVMMDRPDELFTAYVASDHSVEDYLQALENGMFATFLEADQLGQALGVQIIHHHFDGTTYLMSEVHGANAATKVVHLINRGGDHFDLLERQ